MPNIVWNKVVCEGIAAMPIYRTIETTVNGENEHIKEFDFNVAIPEPEGLEDAPGGWENRSYLWLIKKMLMSHTAVYMRDLINEVVLAAEMRMWNVQPEAPKGLESHIRNLIRTGEPSWYEWRRRHWGTKWNAYETNIVDSDTIVFKTAWNPVPTVIKEFAERFGLKKIEYSWVSEEYTENGRMIFTPHGRSAAFIPLKTDERGVPLLFEELFGYYPEEEEE